VVGKVGMGAPCVIHVVSLWEADHRHLFLGPLSDHRSKPRWGWLPMGRLLSAHRDHARVEGAAGLQLRCLLPLQPNRPSKEKQSLSKSRGSCPI
jgi:hypothetical protein